MFVVISSTVLYVITLYIFLDGPLHLVIKVKKNGVGTITRGGYSSFTLLLSFESVVKGKAQFLSNNARGKGPI